MDREINKRVILKNGDTLLELLGYNGKYALLRRLNASPHGQQFIVAVGIEIIGDMCEWGQGRYFNAEKDAKEVYNDYIGGNTTAFMDWCDRLKAAQAFFDAVIILLEQQEEFMADTPKNDDFDFKITPLFDIHPEDDDLTSLPQWKRFVADFRAYCARIATMEKAPNQEALIKLAKVVAYLKAVCNGSELPLTVESRFINDNDVAIVSLMGIGADIRGELKETFIKAIASADMVDLQADDTGEMFHMRFMVYELNTYSRE